VLVVGGRPIGKLCCRLARHYGAVGVWLSEPSAERRSYAEASQADRAFDPTVEVADIERLEVDVVLECSGSEPGTGPFDRVRRPGTAQERFKSAAATVVNWEQGPGA
jgi:threonine dehydrogenase-like Zn-dependent dehydrogenase